MAPTSAVPSSLRVAALALAAWPALATLAVAQPVVHAGKNQTVLGLGPVALHGRVTNLTPLDFWVADGNNATEDKLLKYDDATGVTAVGPLQTAAGKTYGWPSDFERINGTVYGIETFWKQLYTLDGTTGICTPVGSPCAFKNVFGLAYDAVHDKLYGVDQGTRKILLFDRTTGQATTVLTLPTSYSNVHGIAWHATEGLLYFSDDATETLNKVDLATGQVTFVLNFADGPNALVDEITFFHGHLLANYRFLDSITGLWNLQVTEIDLDTLATTPVGPVITDCSTHSLLMNSMPERIHWELVAGPGRAKFADPSDPKTTVRFDTSGKYILELRADGPNWKVADRVAIEVSAPQGRPDPGAGKQH